MRVEQEVAFILHSRPYRETSLLVELFSREHGRIGAVAKGARRPRARHGQLLAPFQRLLVGWSGKGELVTLTGTEAHGRQPVLQGTALYCGFYMNELMLRLLHRHDAHQALFDAYADALEMLVRSDFEIVLRLFEKRLLGELGYALVLDAEINDHSAIRADRQYLYVPDQGPVESPDDRDGGIPVSGAALLAFAREDFRDRALLQECKGLTRAVLARHLGDKPLYSRALFRTINPDAGR